MSFLKELQKQKTKLKETETIVTKSDGQRYKESKDNTVTIEPSTYGFVVDTKPDNIPALIDDHVYIGAQDCTADNVVENYNIKHILSLGIDIQTNVNHKLVNILDLPETNITDMLSDVLPFIKAAASRKENVLVHCNAGVSRTSMVAIAYLIQYKGMTYEEAYSLVKSRRPAVRPNDGFKRQLETMEPGKIMK